MLFNLPSQKIALPLFPMLEEISLPQLRQSQIPWSQQSAYRQREVQSLREDAHHGTNRKCRDLTDSVSYPKSKGTVWSISTIAAVRP